MNKRDYDLNYKQNNIKQIKLDFNTKTESGLLDWLDKQPSKAGYIKSLIKKDMAEHNEAPTYEEGWNDVGYGCEIFVEDGYIAKATKNHGQLPAAIYEPCGPSSWRRVDDLPASEFDWDSYDIK